MDSSCPNCDWLSAPMLAIVSYPTIEEYEANWDKLSEAEKQSVERRKQIIAAWDATWLKSEEQLPDLEGNSLTLTWDGMAVGPDRFTVIKDGETEIWREVACYGGKERFKDVADILKKKYGSRLLDLVPTGRSETYLYGDDWNAVDFVESIRAAIRSNRLGGLFEQTPEVKPEEPKPELSDYGKNNTVFTKEEAEKALQILREKLRQLNTGLDPETISAGIDLEADMKEPTKKPSKDSVPPKRKFYTSQELGNLWMEGLERATKKIADEHKARMALTMESMPAFQRLKEIWRKKYRLKRYLEHLETLKRASEKDDLDRTPVLTDKRNATQDTAAPSNDRAGIERQEPKNVPGTEEHKQSQPIHQAPGTGNDEQLQRGGGRTTDTGIGTEGVLGECTGNGNVPAQDLGNLGDVTRLRGSRGTGCAVKRETSNLIKPEPIFLNNNKLNRACKKFLLEEKEHVDPYSLYCLQMAKWGLEKGGLAIDYEVEETLGEMFGWDQQKVMTWLEQRNPYDPVEWVDILNGHKTATDLAGAILNELFDLLTPILGLDPFHPMGK